MLNVTDLARRLGGVVGGGGSNARAPRVTPDEVLQYLRPQGVAAAATEIDRVVATLPRVVVEERLTRRHPGFRRYFEALPRILFFYGRGYSTDEIANEMHFVATGYGVEAVLGIVAQTVAKRVAAAA